MTNLSQNALKTLTKLRRKKFRRESGKFVAEGARLVQEALQSKFGIEEVIHTTAFRENSLADEIFQLADRRRIPCFETAQKDFAKLSQTVHSQGVLAIVAFKNATENSISALSSQSDYLILAIERLQDPGNLGTILRTGAWFGVDHIVLGLNCVDWTNSKTLRASMGACFHLPIAEAGDFEAFLMKRKANGATVYAAHPKRGKNYNEIAYAKKKILLIGDEAAGLSQASLAVANQNITIPRRGSGESLNAAAAAAVLLAEMTKRL